MKTIEITTKITEKNIEKKSLRTKDSSVAIENLSELVNELEEGQTLSEIWTTSSGVWLTSQCRCEKDGYIKWIHTMDDDAKPYTTNQNVENFPKVGIKQSLFVRHIYDSPLYEITKAINGSTFTQWDRLKKSDLDFLIDNDVNVTIQPPQ